jgi:NAD(P)H dehydrogenase (quinone)
MEVNMNVLVVYAHPNPKSFSHAILEEFTKGLKDGGHTYEVVDLHAENFDPVTKLEDLGQFAGGQMPEDVLEQQKKVTATDAMVFLGPVQGWWIPAILKGWIDRVFSHGFSYRIAEKGDVVGLLKHRKALLMVTTGFPEQVYTSSGVLEAMKNIYLNLTLKMMGIQNTEQITFYGIQMVGDEGRKKYLEDAYSKGKEF